MELKKFAVVSLFAFLILGVMPVFVSADCYGECYVNAVYEASICYVDIWGTCVDDCQPWTQQCADQCSIITQICYAQVDQRYTECLNSC